MKIKLLAVVAGIACLAVLGTGCVSTVSGGSTVGVPFTKDRIEARYQRPLDDVYDAAKQVIQNKGVLVNETILHGQTNAVNNIVKTIEGHVNQSTVWVRVAQVEPKVTDVTVQARTVNGGSDIDLAAQIDKQIALNLVR